MRETILREFFEGIASDRQLADDAAGSLVRSNNHVTVRIERMSSEFAVEARHLIRVCDTVLSRSLDPEYLVAVGFALQASDAFTWDGSSEDGERVAETASDWSAPEINFPLTIENVCGWRSYLMNGTREGLRSVFAC
jgi:hypothetical protein